MLSYFLFFRIKNIYILKLWLKIIKNLHEKQIIGWQLTLFKAF
jgi:hypothetical protein